MPPMAREQVEKVIYRLTQERDTNDYMIAWRNKKDNGGYKNNIVNLMLN